MDEQSNKLRHLEEQACRLLLRSPRLSVSQILELMDISDRDFRAMLNRNTEIANLMAQRKEGSLPAPEATEQNCPVCEDLFIPYASARYCSDECAKTAHLQTLPDATRRLRARHQPLNSNKESSANG